MKSSILRPPSTAPSCRPSLPPGHIWYTASSSSSCPHRLMYPRRCRVLEVYIRKEQAPAEYPLTRPELIHAPGSLCSTTTCRTCRPHSRGVRGYRGHHHVSHG